MLFHDAKLDHLEDGCTRTQLPGRLCAHLVPHGRDVHA